VVLKSGQKDLERKAGQKNGVKKIWEVKRIGS